MKRVCEVCVLSGVCLCEVLQCAECVCGEWCVSV